MYLQLIVLAATIATWVYHRWFEDHPALPMPPQLMVPRTAEGTPLPIVYGQCRLRSPVVVWAGNYFVPDGHFTKVTSGVEFATTHYSVDILFCLGVPFYSAAAAAVVGSQLRGGWAGDTPMRMTINTVASGAAAQACYSGKDPPDSDFTFTGVYYCGTWDQNVLDQSTAFGTTPRTIPDMTAVFGGPADGVLPDGVCYTTDFDDPTGTSFQAAAHQANADVQMPGCRGQMVLWAHVGLGLSPSLPAFQFELLALQTGSAADLGNSFSFDGVGASSDADPASVILDVLTSPWGKVGLSMSQIDLPSFQAVSNTLFVEQHGYSRAFETPMDADQVIRDVLKQIDGVLYQEPTTGKFVLKLIRFDYSVPALDEVNPSNTEAPAAGWYAVQGWAEIPNQVRVTYFDRQNGYAESVAVAQDPSVIATNGGRIRSVSIRYEGCCLLALAQQLASRELAAVGRPMVRATVTVNRSFYAHRPGDVVRLTWPELGISGMVMRIASIDLGQLHQGKITMSLMRDVFDVKIGAF